MDQFRRINAGCSIKQRLKLSKKFGNIEAWSVKGFVIVYESTNLIIILNKDSNDLSLFPAGESEITINIEDLINNN